MGVSNDIESLQNKLRAFAEERDWKQFHSPKNLAMALVGEIGELIEIFQWLTPDESRKVMDQHESAERVREEIADVFGYILRLADVLEIDLAEALDSKVKKNGRKYPVEKARGNSKKYTELA
jgi:NTP pyrophosphatase (non-canonical NTP hydrolase)